MKTEIYGLLSYWNSADLVEYAIQSVLPFCSRIIAADGRYRDFAPKESVESTDGSREIVNKYTQINSHAPRKGWPSQISKQNYLFSKVPKGNYFLVFDSDELFFGSKKHWLRWLQTKPKNGWVREWQFDRYLRLRPRIHFKEGQIEMRGTHYHIYEDDKPLYYSFHQLDKAEHLAPLHFLHLLNSRKDAYYQQKMAFYMQRQKTKVEDNPLFAAESMDQEALTD